VDDYGRLEYHYPGDETLKSHLVRMESLSHLIRSFEQDFKQYLSTLNYEAVTISEQFKHFKPTNEDVFINFNYTDTLKKVYGSTSDYPIHGTVDSSIKIGYNSNIAYYNNDLVSLEYPKPEHIKIVSKHVIFLFSP